jgi:hypothetical protein
MSTTPTITMTFRTNVVSFAVVGQKHAHSAGILTSITNTGMKSAYDNAVYWMSYYSQQENTYRNNISSIESSIKGYRSTLRNHCQEFNSEALLGRGGGTFQTHLEAMIKLLETRKAAMQLTGVGVDELRSLGDSIDKMKKQRSMIVEACGG